MNFVIIMIRSGVSDSLKLKGKWTQTRECLYLAQWSVKIVKEMKDEKVQGDDDVPGNALKLFLFVLLALLAIYVDLLTFS